MLLACGGGKPPQSLFNPPCLTSGPKVYLAVACRSRSPPSYLRRRWWLHSSPRTALVPATEAQRQWLNAGLLVLTLYWILSLVLYALLSFASLAYLVVCFGPLLLSPSRRCFRHCRVDICAVTYETRHDSPIPLYRLRRRSQLILFISKSFILASASTYLLDRARNASDAIPNLRAVVARVAVQVC
ncbi:hypothetical protein HDV63DRAFT_325741 [Trichoderma sp. SZMC 28014]